MTANNKMPFFNRARDSFFVIAVFIVSLGMSVAAFFYEKQRNHDFSQDHFDQETSVVESNLRRTFDAYAQVLRSAVSLYYATDDVDREAWQIYVSNLQLERNYPGIQGVSFNALLNGKAELDAYVEETRETDFPDFEVRPPGDREIYVPIVYLEPFIGRNRPALGFDIYSEATRRAAVDRAILTNEPSMTSKITLVQDDDTPGDDVKAGVLVVLPVFSQALDPNLTRIDQTKGLIVSVFRIRDLMTTILRDDAGQSTAERKMASLYEVADDNEILDMYIASNPDNHVAQFQSERTFELYGRTWRIVSRSTKAFENDTARNSHFLVLFAGLLVTCLLTLVVAAQGARNRDSRVAAEVLGKSNAQIALLMKEVNHRSKNLLGLIQAIARQTSAGDPKDFSESFGRRLSSLSASQDLLVKNKWQDVELSDLLKAQLAYFEDLLDKRIILSGPKTFLDAANAQTMSMAIHELATNATKYGALSNDSGLVHISWRCAGLPPDKTFHLDWVESGGPPVAEPQSKGFGSKVTGMMVQMSLEGEIERRFAPEGFSWHLTCPHRKLAAQVAETSAIISGGTS